MSDNNKRSHDLPPAISSLCKEMADYAMKTRWDIATLDHLAYCLFKDNERIHKLLEENGVQVSKITESINNFLKNNSPQVSASTPQEIKLGDVVSQVISQASLDVLTHGRKAEDLRYMDILLTLLKHNIDETSMVGNLFLSAPEIKNRLIEAIEKNKDGSEEDFDDCLTDLNQLAIDGKIDPVIGREKEILEITEILSRKKKNNAMLLGNPGVGKTAVVEGIALAIVNGECHEVLKDKKIWILDVSGLLAGTKYRGEFEEKARNALNKLAEDQNAIVFIDEIHTVMGAGSSTQGGVDLGNMMKPMLARGDLMCIGATTWDEYNAKIQKDKAMIRRFQNYTIDEPDLEHTKEILSKLLPVYSEFHNVTYDETAIEDTIKLCTKYIQNRAFPDKAIDVLDASGAYAKIHHLSTVDNPVVTKIVSRISNVPEQAMHKTETNIFENLGDNIKRNLFGQDHAVDDIVDEILIAKTGLGEENKPIGSFLLNGTTGVGKTELARQLAKNLEIPLLKYDMSEYQEKHSVSKLIGSPPGYVGYEENSAKLIDDIEKNPNCVLLLDEVEKAHASVLTVLLQIMDDARLTSSQGKTVSFKNVIVLMSANLGTREKNEGSIGFMNDAHESADLESVNKFFSPEFINRLNGVISFNNLSKDNMLKIIDKEIKELNVRLGHNDVVMSLDNSAKEKLVNDGFDKAMGARPLKRIITQKIKKPLSRAINSGKLKNGGNVSVFVNDGEFQFLYS